MKILEYIGLDTSRVTAAYRKVIDAIFRGDFRAAQVKKLANLSLGKFYRAKLNDADRLLFSLAIAAECAMAREERVAYERWRTKQQTAEPRR
ncbi:MAG: hypothetical protein ACYC9J_07815 [Sulfuricaulis sp.]